MHPNPKPPRRVRVERGIYRNPSTGGLEIQYTDSTGRVRWRATAGGVKEARYERAEIQARLGRGELVIHSDFTVAELAEAWLAAQHHLKPRTRTGYETALELHIKPRLGKRRIGEITVDRVAAFIRELEQENLSGSTIGGVLTPLAGTFRFAARRGLISANPLSQLERNERPRRGRREMRILDYEEIDALLKAVIPAYRPVIATAVFTGLRQGELLGLVWADVDFADSVVQVRCQLDRSGERTTPKTTHAYRQVILMPSLAALLREHKHASLHPAANDPVFATLTGAPMYYRNVTRRGFTAAVKRAGLDRPGESRLRFHDLRHTFASLLVSQGLNVVFISRQLGHASASFTLNTYAHLFDRAEHARRATEALEAKFGSVLSDVLGGHSAR